MLATFGGCAPTLARPVSSCRALRLVRFALTLLCLTDVCEALSPPLGTPLLQQLVASEGVLAPKLTLADFDGLRGVAATEPIDAGELILSVPLDLAFTDTELGLPTSIDSSARLAAALCVEVALPPSRRAAHIRAMPAAPVASLAGRLPPAVRLHMPADLRLMAEAYDERDEATVSALLPATRRRKKGKPRDERMELLQQVLGTEPSKDGPRRAGKGKSKRRGGKASSGARGFSVATPSDPPEAATGEPTQRSLRWALDMVASRSYGLVTAGASDADPIPGASLAQMVAAGEVELVQVVCPILDMFNHAAGARTRVALQRSPSGSCVEVFAGDSILAGEQLFLSYGPKSTNRLLASYGFVPSGRNPHTFVSLSGALSDEQFTAFATAGDPRIAAELSRWQDAEFRVYDSGPHGSVDSTLVVVGRIAVRTDATDAHSKDVAVANDLAARARAELLACSTLSGELQQHGTLEEALQASEEMARSEDCSADECAEASALALVLRCRLAEAGLWERFARGLEAFAASTRTEAQGEEPADLVAWLSAGTEPGA